MNQEHQQQEACVILSKEHEHTHTSMSTWWGFYEHHCLGGFVVAMVFTFFALSITHAQYNNSDGVVWKDIMPAPKQANWGRDFNLTVPNDPGTPRPTGAPENITREDGGEDWWYDVCEIFEGGILVGYGAGGYNTMPNWGFIDPLGCRTGRPGAGWEESEFETATKRKGELRCWIARYDLLGEMVWCRSYFAGTFYGITQDSDGSLVAVGETNYTKLGETIGTDHPFVGYNPGWANINVNMAEVDCTSGTEPLGVMAIKPIAVKVNLAGDLVWANCYGATRDFGQTSWSSGGRAHAIQRIELPGGAPGLYIVCESKVVGSGFDPGLFALRIAQDGTVHDEHLFDNTDPSVPTDAIGLYVYNVDAEVYSGQNHLLISGAYTRNGAPRAFLWHINDATNAPFTVDPLFNLTTEYPAIADEHLDDIVQISTSATLVENNGQLMAVWPVLSDYVYNDPYAPNAVATLKVHGLPIANPASGWTANLGEVRAYDLRAGVVGTSDGGIAVVSTKWTGGYTIANPFCWDDLSQITQTCLENNYGTVGWNGGMNGPCALDKFRYWNTDSFVAKLDRSSGTLLWETKFDAEPGSPSGCFPDDMRKNECMYQIVEADDGGVVICGNTSHNFDDAYLAKVKPSCQSSLSFDQLPLDEQGQYTLQSNETWSTDRNIYGTIVVPNGKILTINNNAVIRFADSEQLYWRTRVVVETGGKLILDDAKLSAVLGCEESMWDGVEVLGIFNLQQTDQNQGVMELTNGAVVEHARAGIVTAQVITDSPYGIIKESTGGIVRATDATFRNNQYDVVLNPFENRTSSGTVLPNNSYFKGCHFLTQGDLNDPDLVPHDHIGLRGVRAVQIRGCEFKNSIVGSSYEYAFEQGVGVHAINASFIVSNDCSSPDPLPNPGPPCPEEYTATSTFTNLHYGIVATTFDLSRSFSVSDATFTGTNFGIRMEGIQDAAIHRNTFTVPQPIIAGLVGTVYGVYSDQCTGYSIQENHFATTQPSGSNSKVGLVIKDSGPYSNTFYNNTFDNFKVGSLIEGKNALANGTIGLEVKCNDYGLTNKNTYDVLLSGTNVYIQKTQGTAAVLPTDYTNPAGNRFSTAHVGANPEEDWGVENISTFVEYFNHQSTSGNRTKPEFHDLTWLIPNGQNVFWPSQRALACPTHLVTGGPIVKRLIAGEADDEYHDNKDAYDAAKDNGDTYSLLGYVTDPGHTSTQVRNALQSVAPKVSTEVWQAAFERMPTLSAWHTTQALLSNSPLEGEVLYMVEVYGLPSAYSDLVTNAQSGEVNILGLLKSMIANYGSIKSEALTDLSRMAWLETEDIGYSLDSLLLTHGAIPAWNSSLAESGVLAAKGDYSALEQLAANEMLSSECPEMYELIKRSAEAEQENGWAECNEGTIAWLQQLGAQRDVIGSAHANAWLHALGTELPPEIIILPNEGPKSRKVQTDRTLAWPTDLTIDVFPNPSNGPVMVAYEVPEGAVNVELRLMDIHGKTLKQLRLGDGQGLAQLNTEPLAAGVYMTVLSLDGIRMAHQKVVVER